MLLTMLCAYFYFSSVFCGAPPKTAFLSGFRHFEAPHSGATCSPPAAMGKLGLPKEWAGNEKVAGQEKNETKTKVLIKA